MLSRSFLSRRRFWIIPVALILISGMTSCRRKQKQPDNHSSTAEKTSHRLKEVPGDGVLHGIIETNQGEIDCELFEEKAPITVANFVGLSLGTREWEDVDGKSTSRPLFNETVFHRVIPRFMIQGGDPKGNGSGGPGYEFEDEIWPGSSHNRAGQLCMANRGPGTNGSQFFITDAPAPHLDGKHTIFGQCKPLFKISEIASVKRDASDRPASPIVIAKIRIERRN